MQREMTKIASMSHLIKRLFEKMQKRASSSSSSSSSSSGKMRNGVLLHGSALCRKGQFSVYAIDGAGQLHKFAVDLCCLTYPSFLKLLETAAEEFGFAGGRPLVIPCHPDCLQQIISQEYRSRTLSKHIF